MPRAPQSTIAPQQSLQQQARALGDPTRHRLYRYVVERDAPVGVAELTEHAGVHHNAVRRHLAQLTEVGLLRCDHAPRVGRGRPRLVYSAAAEWVERWGGAGPYERLSALLAELVRSGDTPDEVGRRVGWRAGTPARSGTRDPESGTGTANDGSGALMDALAREGFAPAAGGTDAAPEIVLARCPYETAVRVDPTTICQLHRGLVEGVLAGSSTSLVGLVAKDPGEAGCVLRLAPADPPDP